MKILKPVHAFFGLLSFVLLGLTSCGDIQQDLYLNADGSGKLEASFELGEMMSMMKGFGDMDVKDVTISEDQPVDSIQTTTEEPKDPMQAIMDKVTDPEYALDFDTLINLYDLMPDSVKAKETRPDLVKKALIRIQSPAKSSDLTIGMVLNFDNYKQLNDIIHHMDTIDNQSLNMAGGASGGFPKETFMIFESNLKEGWIRVDSVDYAGLGGDMSLGMPGDTTSGSEDMAMMEMMFGNSKIKSTIHVPGEVLSCSNKDAILTKDNKVIIEHEFMDVLRLGKVPGYTIYFKPKN